MSIAAKSPVRLPKATHSRCASLARRFSFGDISRILVSQVLPLLIAIAGFHAIAVAQSAPFTVSLSQSTLTAYPGTAHDIQVQVSSSSGYQGAVAITLTGMPTGVTASPASLSLTPGSSGTITLTSAINADAQSFPAVSGQANSSTKTITFVGNANGTTAAAALAFTTSLANASFNPDQGSTGLAVVQITTTGGAAITSTDTYVTGSVTIVPAANSSYSGYTGTMQVKGHGNSTWYMPKKPYKLKLDSKASLLGMPSNKSWVLLANYDDKTMLRDYVASEISNRLGLPWAPHSGYVELYLNGAYMGTYELIEQVKVASSRVNITSLAETDTTSPAITGGYLLEIDNRQDQAFTFTTTRGVPFGLDDPDFTPDPEVPEQTSYIQNYVQSAEDALYSSTYTDPTTGWPSYFDSNSLVNFYLVNEIMGNRDGGRFYSSDYVYKNRNNPLLYMGPVWDFDISSGNENQSTIENPTVPWMSVRASWYVQLFTDPAFKAMVVNQWNATRSAQLDTLPAFIDQAAATVAQAQSNNFTRWPILGETVWPNAQALGTYQAEVDYFKTWLKLRIAYLDSQFNGKAASQTTLNVDNTGPHLGDTITLTSTVTDASAAPITSGTVSFLAGPMVVGSASLDGTGTATLPTGNLPLGTNAVTAVYNGNGSQGLSASNPVSVNVTPAVSSTTVQLSASTTSTQQGSPVTLAATITANDGAGVPTGTIAFNSGSTNLGSATLSNGSASATFTNLPVGNDSVSATYSGGGNYLGSTSGTVTVTVAATQATATPVFSPVAGTYSTAQSVTISDSTSGAVIHYTTDSSTPTASSPVYSTAITVSSSETLKAMATASGMLDSAVATAAYVIQASGGTCSAPDSPGVNICAPTGGGFYPSPLQITAAGKGASGTVRRMEVWIDGVKNTQFSSSTINTSVTVATGSHRLVIVEVDSNNASVKSPQVNFTIGSNPPPPSCSIPTSPVVHVCAPTSGGSYSSPVTFTASAAPASGTVSRIELWIDGKKINNYNGASLNTSVAVATGSHHVTFVEADNKGGTIKSAQVPFTVK